ncbi:hypothetical protein [Tellurirhabdus rosea]|uniref:hypothetical protein n=1 Tax=Tellurirhabdus rosea TaxID=2674997 RepID=UPI00224F3067|nr:hypothetical protein [Tellurirhabdus rosea]
MKTILLFAALLLATPSLFAQSAAYKEAMTAALETMKTQSQKTPLPEMLATANQFERIAQAEAKEWLPRYYAGLLYVYAGFMGKDAAEKDRYLDQADRFLKEAEGISPKNDELSVLKAYIAQARMVVDPMNRWQTYGPAFEEAIGEAKALNPANPRPYVLHGSSLYHTPEQFGGGLSAACPLLTQASEKFATFKPASELHPNWGQKNIEPLLGKCAK